MSLESVLASENILTQSSLTLDKESIGFNGDWHVFCNINFMARHAVELKWNVYYEINIPHDLVFALVLLKKEKETTAHPAFREISV